MTRNTLLQFAFGGSLLLIFTGAFLKILHIGGALSHTLMIASVIASIIFIILAIFEVNSSPRLSTSEKIMWTVGFLFFNIIAGLLYFLVARPRINREYKILNRNR